MNLDKLVGTRLTEATKKRLRALAEKKGVSVSELTREAVVEYLRGKTADILMEDQFICPVCKSAIRVNDLELWVDGRYTIVTCDRCKGFLWGQVEPF